MNTHKIIIIKNSASSTPAINLSPVSKQSKKSKQPPNFKDHKLSNASKKLSCSLRLENCIGFNQNEFASITKWVKIVKGFKMYYSRCFISPKFRVTSSPMS